MTLKDGSSYWETSWGNSSGILSASGASISGSITATSGTIGGIERVIQY